MTVSPVDPGEFLDQDPVALVAPDPLGDQILVTPPPDDRRRQRVELALGAAFVAIALMMRQALQGLPPDSAPGAVEAGRRAWTTHLPLWVRLAVPAVKQAYALGQVGDGLLTEDELTAMATKYVDDLGDYLAETSTSAVAEGFATQLQEGGWNQPLAWSRASQAWGLDSAQMRGYTRAALTGRADPMTDPVPIAARMLIDRGLMHRADTVARSEVPRAIETGKALAWMSMQADGRIGPDAMRVWVKGGGENHCELCTYLDGRAVPLSEWFTGPNGERIFAPGAHPRCQCETRLEDPELEDVEKAMGSDPYDRTRGGRFAPREERTAKPVAERTRTLDPAVAAIQAQLAEVTDEPTGNIFESSAPTSFESTARSGLFESALPNRLEGRGRGSGSFESTARRPGERDEQGRVIGPDGKPRRRVVLQQLLLIKKPLSAATEDEPDYEPEPGGAWFITREEINDSERYAGMWPGQDPYTTGGFIPWDDWNYNAAWAYGQYDDDEEGTGEQFAFKAEEAPADASWWAMAGEKPDPRHDNPVVQKIWYDEILPKALDLRNRALTDPGAVIDQLSRDELFNIFELADFDPTGADDARLREILADGIDRQYAGRDNSLAAAYVDHVVWTSPELLGADGERFGQDLEMDGRVVLGPYGDPEEVDFPEISPQFVAHQIFSWPKGFPSGTTYEAWHGGRRLVPLSGNSRILDTSYHSGLLDLGRDMRIDQTNLQVITLTQD